MFKSLACAVALCSATAAADAAIYRYDVTMERTYISYPVWGDGFDAPEIVPDGVSCSLTDGIDYVYHSCSGDLGPLYEDEFAEVISGSFVIDTDAQNFDFSGFDCFGSGVLCGNRGTPSYFSGDENGFNFTSLLGAGAGGYLVSHEGLSYQDDNDLPFSVGNTYYSAVGLDVRYTTTMLDIIAPVPLPAGMLLLPSALALLGLRRRRSSNRTI